VFDNGSCIADADWRRGKKPGGGGGIPGRVNPGGGGKCCGERRVKLFTEFAGGIAVVGRGADKWFENGGRCPMA
jgi:hypothetical protein